MYWVCVRCGESFYTASRWVMDQPQRCQACGSVTGAEFDSDPEVASTANLLTDDAGRVIAISRELESLTGWSDFEAIGIDSAELIGALGPDIVFRELETLTGSTLLECHVGVLA